MTQVQFNGHIYEMTIWRCLTWYWKRAHGVNETPKPLVISHGMGCCDYWMTDTDTVYRTLLDDALTTKGTRERR